MGFFSFLFGGLGFKKQVSEPVMNFTVKTTEKPTKTGRNKVSIKPTRHIKKPKGTKKYYFDKDGKFVNKITDGVDIVLVVIAINDHNAQRKFWKWKQTQATV